MASAALSSCASPIGDAERRQGALFYKPELDALRLLAFLMVFAHHILPRGAVSYADRAPWAARLAAALGNAGGFGLPLFFCLSGYLIATLLLKERAETGRIDLGAFYLRRLFRIAPLYLLGIAIGTLWTLAVEDGEGLAMFASYLALAGNWWFQSHDWSLNPMTQLWSISVEEQFYLFFPLALIAGGPRRLPLIGGGLVAASLAALFVQGEQHRAVDTAIWTSTLSQAIFLGTGLLLASAMHGRRVPVALRGRLVLAAASLALMVIAAVWTDIKHLGLASSGESVAADYALVAFACAAAMVAVADWPGRVPALFVAGGRLSFGLYVFHQLALKQAHLIVGDRLLPLALVGLAIAWGTAAVAQIAIEEPMRRVRARFAVVPTYAQPSST